MELTAIIVSYNVKYYLAQCITSLYKARPDIEIVVMDNNSHDGPEEYIHKIFSQEYGTSLHFISNKENIGFGRGNNRALKEAHGRYILFINPDTFVSEDSLSACLAFLHSHPDAGIIGTRMLNINGTFARESRRGVPMPMTSFYKLCGLASLFPNSPIFGKYYMQHLDATQVCKIDIVSGAFMMISRALLERYGAFDEDFFMYGEDIELSFRIMKQHYQNYYIPTRILHYKGESTNKASRKYINDFYMAMLIFFRKHHPHARFLYPIIYISVYLLSFKATLAQWFVRMRNRLGLGQNSHARYLFCGSEKMLSQARVISSEASLDSTFEAARGASPSEILSSITEEKIPTYIVFDMDTFTYADILEAFDATGKTNLMIGTHYPALGLVLTNEDTFTLNIQDND